VLPLNFVCLTGRFSLCASHSKTSVKLGEPWTIEENRISKETGVDETQLCIIMEDNTYTVETADIFLKYFGLTITKKNKKKGKEYYVESPQPLSML